MSGVYTNPEITISLAILIGFNFLRFKKKKKSTKTNPIKAQHNKNLKIPPKT